MLNMCMKLAYLPTLTLSFSRLKWEMGKKKLKNMYLSLGEHASPVTFLTLPPLKFVTCTSPPPVTSSPPPPQKTKDFSAKGGGGKFVTYTSQTPVTFFNPPPPQKTTDFPEKGGGGVKIVKNTWPTLVTFFTPPPKVSKSYYIYGIYQKKVIVTYIFDPPPLKGQ